MISTTCLPHLEKVKIAPIKMLNFNWFLDPTDKYLEDMMAEAPGPINFTMFLTMFGEKLNGTDPEEVIRNAFACFDDENSGKSKICHRFVTIFWLRRDRPIIYV